MSSLPERAAAFLALAEKALDAPWAVRFGTYAVHQPELHYWIPQDINDSNFVVAARNDAPALVRDLLAENERLVQERVEGVRLLRLALHRREGYAEWALTDQDLAVMRDRPAHPGMALLDEVLGND